MPKLLQINVSVNWGSTGKIAEQIGLCAMTRGWESYIAYGRYSNPSMSHTIKIGTTLDTYMHYGEQKIRDNEGLCSRRATRKLIEQIKKIKPDIVNLHNIHDHYLNYQLLFKYFNQTDIKIVWTFHDCWAFTGHCFHFVTRNCTRWKTGCYFENNRNLSIVACSDWIAGFVRESFFKKNRLEIFHNGCDINIFKPCNETTNAKFSILAVSSVWHPSKGELDIYKLRTMLPINEYEIVMVGLSATQLKNLPAGIRGYQRTQNVQELVQLYSNADVLINPTYADNFPTVNIESLASGTPVISYQTGGSPEALNKNVGAVVKQGDISALRNMIIEFRSCNFKQKHSSDCRRWAEEKFDKNKCFEKYIDLYEELLYSK